MNMRADAISKTNSNGSGKPRLVTSHFFLNSESYTLRNGWDKQTPFGRVMLL
jgi:hypothetical protein